jgi:hypothetical protein
MILFQLNQSLLVLDCHLFHVFLKIIIIMILFCVIMIFSLDILNNPESSANVLVGSYRLCELSWFFKFRVIFQDILTEWSKFTFKRYILKKYQEKIRIKKLWNRDIKISFSVLEDFVQKFEEALLIWFDGIILRDMQNNYSLRKSQSNYYFFHNFSSYIISRIFSMFIFLDF